MTKDKKHFNIKGFVPKSRFIIGIEICALIVLFLSIFIAFSIINEPEHTASIEFKLFIVAGVFLMCFIYGMYYVIIIKSQKITNIYDSVNQDLLKIQQECKDNAIRREKDKEIRVIRERKDYERFREINRSIKGETKQATQ